MKGSEYILAKPQGEAPSETFVETDKEAKGKALAAQRRPRTLPGRQPPSSGSSLGSQPRPWGCSTWLPSLCPPPLYFIIKSQLLAWSPVWVVGWEWLLFGIYSAPDTFPTSGPGLLLPLWDCQGEVHCLPRITGSIGEGVIKVSSVSAGNCCSLLCPKCLEHYLAHNRH